MRSTKYFKVTIYWILLITSTQGYNYGWSSMASQIDTVSESEINSFLINPYERERLHLSVDQVHSETPPEIPSCLYEGHIYDATATVCGQPRIRAHCGEGMTFLPVPDSQDLGACTCHNSNDCWERPQFLTQDNECYGIATKGPCNNGETLVPIFKFYAECGPDVCLDRKPENAINFSEQSKQHPENYPVFNFTYLGKCYTTESQAFCPRGRAVRFVVPFKTPVCINANNVTCLSATSQYSIQVGTLRGCGPGLEANPSRGICQPISSFDF